jgi:hypothetical protein
MKVRLIKCPGLAEVVLPDDATLGDLLDRIAAATQHRLDLVSILVKGKRLDATRAAEPLAVLLADRAPAIVMIKADAVAAIVDSTAAAAAHRRSSLETAERAARLIAERRAPSEVAGGEEETELELLNEHGQVIVLPELDHRGVALGYMLHAKAKALLATAQRALLGVPDAETRPEGDDAAPAGAADRSGACALVDDASELLEAAHAAFAAVDPKVLALGDNYALVCIDTAWAFLLAHLPQDGGSGVAVADRLLATVRGRLDRAQRQLAELHGPALEKLDPRGSDASGTAYGQARATYVRLRLLLGVLAYHEGRMPAARDLLRSANELCLQLTLTSDDDLSIAQLVSLGVSHREAARSLLACGKDVDRAALHAFAAREQRAATRAHEVQRSADRRASAQLGLTASGQPISARLLRELESVGVGRALAVAALARVDNSIDAALTALASDEVRGELELAAAQTESLAALAAQHVEALVSSGFERADVKRAMRRCGDDGARALEALTRAQAGGAAAGSCGEPAAVGLGDGGAGPSEAGAVSAGPDEDAEVDRARRDNEEQLIDESGLVRAVNAVEAAYQRCDLRCEAAALKLYLALICHG